MECKANVSTLRNVMVWLILYWRCDFVISQGLGFNTFDICSTSHITENQGSIVSPGYPNNNNYPSNTNCRINVPGRRVKLIIADIHIQWSGKCKSDWLKISKCNGNIPYKTLCGLNYEPIPTTLEFPSGNVSLEFNSDSTSNYRGFRIDFLATDYDVFELCKSSTAENQLNSEKGIITSPNYPGNYDNLKNKKCSKLVPFSNHVFEIRVRSFKLDDTFNPQRCGGFCDWIKFGQDGEYIPEQLARRGPFVPLQIFPRVNVLVEFMSDSLSNERGFVIEYQGGNKFYEMCVDQTVPLHHDLINVISQNYPFNYADDKKCEMIIMAPLNYFIQVNSSSFGLQNARSCEGCCDWFMVEEIMSNSQSSGNNSTLLDKECGETSFHVISSTNRIKLKFKSDRSFTTSGFSVIVKAISQPLIPTTSVDQETTGTSASTNTGNHGPAIGGAIGGLVLLVLLVTLLIIIFQRGRKKKIEKGAASDMELNTSAPLNLDHNRQVEQVDLENMYYAEPQKKKTVGNRKKQTRTKLDGETADYDYAYGNIKANRDGDYEGIRVDGKLGMATVDKDKAEMIENDIYNASDALCDNSDQTEMIENDIYSG